MREKAQSSQQKQEGKEVTIDGRTQLIIVARRRIITKVRQAHGKLSILTDDEKNWILRNTTAKSTKPIREALEKEEPRLSTKQLQQLPQYKPSKKTMVTIDGQEKTVTDVRNSIIKKVCQSHGDLSILTDGEKKWISNDTTAKSTKPIREALKNGKTQLSKEQL